jgi:hypothetical protein
LLVLLVDNYSKSDEINRTKDFYLGVIDKQFSLKTVNQPNYFHKRISSRNPFSFCFKIEKAD